MPFRVSDVKIFLRRFHSLFLCGFYTVSVLRFPLFGMFDKVSCEGVKGRMERNIGNNSIILRSVYF